MNHVMKLGLGVALSFMTLAQSAAADDFKLSNNQRIACSRGLSAGKLNTSTCKSYAYVFNTKTSEYFRCQVSLALTRDNKEVINVQADGGCAKKPRICEVKACRPWLEAELRAVKPALLVCLGATAAQSVMGSQFRLMTQRGQVLTSALAEKVIATIHPSAVLRAPDPEARRVAYEMLVSDLKLVARTLK